MESWMLSYQAIDTTGIEVIRYIPILNKKTQGACQ